MVKDEQVKLLRCYLSEGMTLKNSLAGINMGGGKAVLNTKQKTPEMMRKFGELINELNGVYIHIEVLNHI